MLDGCGVGQSEELREFWFVQQCNHNMNIYVKPNTVIQDYNFKVHDSLCEWSFKQFRKSITMRSGLVFGQNDSNNIKALTQYAMINDLVANYTSGKANDCLYTWLSQLGKFWPTK